MQTINYSLRYLLKRRGNSFTRLLSISLGLIVALIIFSYVGLNLSYNRFFPNKGRIYQLYVSSPQFGVSDKMNLPFATNLASDIPQIETSTHIIDMLGQITHNGETIDVELLQTNSSFFDVLDFGVVSGDAAKILSSEGAAANEVMISERLAGKLFGKDDPLGKELDFKGVERKKIVAGVFKTPPVNQSIGNFDILEHLHYNENNEAWTGGDSYPTFIKLHKGADIAEVEAAMPAFFKKHGLENMNNTWQKKYFFINIADTMYVTGNILHMQIIYGVIAFIALLVACLNYVLLTISSLAERSKTIATMKCNGAVRGKIFSMLLGETLLIIIASVLLVIFIIACMHQVIYGYFGYTVSELFALERIWIPAVVCIAGFAIAGIMPAFLFSVINTSYAFKYGGENRQWWKKFLLFLQITATVATVIFFMVINRQSAHIINADYGYKFDKIVTTSMSVKISKAEALANEISRLPFVEAASASSSLPIWGYSGMPCVDENGQLLFSCRWEVIDHNYIPTMQMQIVAGRNFVETDAADKAIVNETYVEKRGWEDSPIGKTIYDSSMKAFEIVGVIADFNMLKSGEALPLVMHPTSYVGAVYPDFETSIQYNIRLKEINAENLKALEEAILPIYGGEWKFSLYAYSDRVKWLFSDVVHMRFTMLFVTAIVLFISLIGLIGYVSGEVARRRKEVVIRKVCGASTVEILTLLSTKMTWIVLPAAVCGIAVAAWGNESYLSTLAQMRCTVPQWFYLAGVAIVAAIVYIVQAAIIWHTATANPIEMMKR